MCLVQQKTLLVKEVSAIILCTASHQSFLDFHLCFSGESRNKTSSYIDMVSILWSCF